MRLSRSNAVVAAVLLASLLACGDGLTAPAGAVLGTFGGPLLGVKADRRFVLIQLPCAAAIVEANITPDADGRFLLPEAQILGDRARSVTVELTGQVSGDRMEAVIRTRSPYATNVATYTIARAQPADFSRVNCAAELAAP